MATNITDFYPGTTKVFTVTCKIDDVAVDITSDVVNFRMKTSPYLADTACSASVIADVATSGSAGEAIITLSASDNNLAPGTYYGDVEWVRASNAEYVVVNQKIIVFTRVSAT